jgi:hypothetical protein
VRAEYETRGETMVGARIQVHDKDGASRVETVEVWEPPERIVLRLHEFTPPLSRLARITSTRIGHILPQIKILL